MKKLLVAFCSFVLCLSAFCEGKLSSSLTTDFAYYPKSDYITGKTHFAPLTGVYSGVELRTTYDLSYKIPTPLGESWLVKDANVVLSSDFEVSPVSFCPKISVSFTPFPFLVFSAGGAFGWGWNVIGLEGLCYFDDKEVTYKPLNTFKNFYYSAWGKGTFQFDTGALIPGDWTHVVMQASYKLNYEGIANLDKGTIYEWQASKNKANGLKFYSTLILAYQMPLVLYRAGIKTDLSGNLTSGAYGKYSDSYKGDFVPVDISPFVQFNFGSKDSLYVLAAFSSRRSYKESHTTSIQEPLLTTVGREWYFYRVALSWEHKF